MNHTQTNKYINEGRKFKSQNQLDKALDSFNLAIKLEPNFCLAYYELALALTCCDRWQEAVVAYETAIKIKPDFWRAQIDLAKALKQINRTEEALFYLQQVIDQQPTQPFWVYKLLGDLLTNQEELEAAILAYRQAVQLKPDLPIIVYVNLAMTLLQEQNLTEVLSLEKLILDREFKESEKSNFVIAKLQSQIGNFFLEKKNLNNAVQYYLKAIHYNPEIREAYAKLRLVQISMKIETSYLEETIYAYKTAIKKNPTLPKQAYINLGDLLTQQNNISEAIKYYQYASKQNLLDRGLSLEESNLESGKTLEPRFIIIGSMKGGTTSLYNYITEL